MRCIARIMRTVRISEATLSPSSKLPPGAGRAEPKGKADKRPNGERDAEREKEKGLLETRGEGAGGKARAVDPPHGDGVAYPDTDGRQLADQQR